jgi:hypothetical protein
MKPVALPRPLHVVNEGLAFLLEVIMLVALGVWGAAIGSTRFASVLFAIAAPLAAAIVWGLFAAPRARIRLPMAGILVVKALAFASAVAAIDALGHRQLALGFALVALVNTAVATADRNAAMRVRP